MIRTPIALAFVIALASSLSTASADDEPKERGERIRAEMERLRKEERETQAAFEKEMAAAKAEVVSVRAEREKIEATPQERRGDHLARIEALAKEEARLAERVAALQARWEHFRKDIEERKARLAESVAEMWRAAATPTRPSEGPRVTVEYRDTPVREALERLAKESGLSYAVVADRLGEERITAAFRDVPAADAATAILEVAGYRYVRSPAGVLLVYGRHPKSDLEELEFQVEILELEARRRELEKALGESRDE